jgi:hypothetical protein
MEVIQCHDCEVDIVFINGLPGGAQIGVCSACGEKRRRLEASKPEFEGFSRESWRLLINGQPAAISSTRTY